MQNKKFYRTTIEVTVLSEEPYLFRNLEQTAFDIVDGDCSGVCRVVKTEVCDAQQMAEYLEEQGSDPAFFGINQDEQDGE